MTSDTKICFFCNKGFSRTSLETYKRWVSRKYCSHKCYWQARKHIRTGIYKKCEICGKKFYAKPYQQQNKRFCSLKCWLTSPEIKAINRQSLLKTRSLANNYIGKNNPNWKGGCTPENHLRLSRKSWKKLSQEALCLYGYKCLVCGTNESLVVHHHIPWREGGEDKIENLVVLCSRCHPKAEHNMKFLWAIEAFCYQCSVEPKLCTDEGCPLFPYRPYQEIPWKARSGIKGDVQGRFKRKTSPNLFAGVGE